MNQPQVPNLVFQTSDLMAAFSAAVGVHLDHRDAKELLHQLFEKLSTLNPMDINDENLLDLSRFMFLANYPDVNSIPLETQQVVNKAAYAVLVQLHVRATDANLALEGKTAVYLPYLMIGNDVCLTQFQTS